MVGQCSVSITAAEEFKYGKILWDRNKVLQLCEDPIQEALHKDDHNTNNLTGKLFEEFMKLLDLFCKKPESGKD